MDENYEEGMQYSASDVFSEVTENSGVMESCRLFFVRYAVLFRILYLVCWGLLFFRHSFDHNERIFRVPLLLLSAPVLLGLRYQGIFRFLRRSPLAWGVVGMILAACVASWLSPFPDSRSYRHIVFGWFVLSLSGFTVSLAFPDKGLRVLLLGLTAGLLASGLFVAIGIPLGWVDGQAIFLSEGRLELFTAYPTRLGFMAGFALTGLFFFRRHRRSLLTHGLDLALMAVLFVLLLLSQTRSALFAFAAAAGLTLVLAARSPKRRVAAVLLCGLLGIGAAWTLGQYGPLKESAPYQRMLALISHPLEDPSITGRLGLWEVAANSIPERPVLGYGVRMFPNVYTAYMEQHGEELRAKYAFVESNGGHAHNLALGALTELGLVGFLALLLIFVTVFRAGKNAPSESDLRCLQVLLAFFLVHGLADYMLNLMVYSDLFFVSVGLFMGAEFQRGLEEGGGSAGSAVQA